uniref:Uncharacterized protein n=1 Tax=Oryza brachyantha TaxID=4533 RepID=J3KUX9_ORYBR
SDGFGLLKKIPPRSDFTSLLAMDLLRFWVFDRIHELSAIRHRLNGTNSICELTV